MKKRCRSAMCLILAGILCLTGIACEQTIDNNKTMDPGVTASWLALRTYQTENGGVLYANRNYGAAHFDLYQLVWNLKAADILGVVWSLPEGDEYELLRSSVESLTTLNAPVLDTYGLLYGAYLYSQLYQKNRDLFRPQQREWFIDAVLSCQNRGVFQEKTVERTDLSSTCLAVWTLEGWGYDLSQLEEVYHNLLEQFLDLEIPPEHGEHANDTIFFELLRTLSCFPAASDRSKIEEKAAEYLRDRQSYMISRQIDCINLTLFSNAAQVTLDGLVDCTALLRSAVTALTDETVSQMDVQSQYEYALICRALGKQCAINTWPIQSWLENRLYLGQFKFTYEALYYGLLCAQKLGMENLGQAETGYRALLEQNQLKTGDMMELCYYLRLCRLFSSPHSMAETEEILEQYLAAEHVWEPKEMYGLWCVLSELDQAEDELAECVREQAGLALDTQPWQDLLTDELYCMAVLNKQLGGKRQDLILEQLEQRYVERWGGYSLSQDQDYLCLSATYLALQVYELYGIPAPHGEENHCFARSCQQNDGSFAENTASSGYGVKTVYYGLCLTL